MADKICPCCAAQTVVTRGMSLCKYHRADVYKHIYTICLQENSKAWKHGLTGDLTAEQFTVSAAYFVVVEGYNRTYACAYCGKKSAIGLDHWIPITQGGASTFTNVIPCCFTCNVLKGNFTGDEFLDYMIDTWKSPVAMAARENIDCFWKLVNQGVNAVYESYAGHY